MVIRTLKILTLIIIAITIVGCSATPTRRSFKEGWKDSVVSTKVKYKLTSDKLVKKRNVDVDTWRGVVTLTGRVTSPEEKERAEQLAWQVRGVRGVDNFLKLVEDAMAPAGEAVAARTPEEVDLVDTPKVAPPKKIQKAPVKPSAPVANALEKAPAPAKLPAHPIKTTEPKVSNKVAEPMMFEEADMALQSETKRTARRESFKKPVPSQIQEEDLTDEDRLARDAAEELKKLKGEEDISE